MDVLQTILQQLAATLSGTTGWIQSHLSAICTAIVTTLLVIFGDEINGFIKDRIRGFNFFIRTGAFVLLCVFGYGMLAAAGASAIRSLLLYFGGHYLPLTVIAAFVVMGMLAERKKYM
ncbi:MAG TPA: DUF3392 family protein [Candidatus Latescibacteria bacterium]|jgi:hypothetical protein|nr:hypothetical protein [Gemmatimonadaceae bacterium]MDP6019173.1 DUF3392 family protein [Candidatus Latescibacterota bacterium]HJP32240.1 DUF3392 family protein [Candidatus Latescibacterota bacterium]